MTEARKWIIGIIVAIACLGSAEQIAEACTATGKFCVFDTDCCSDWCDWYTCEEGCIANGDSCVWDDECCSGWCEWYSCFHSCVQLKCQSGDSWCINSDGEYDHVDNDCSCGCSGGTCDSCPSCSNDCSPSGKKDCVDSQTIQTCGNYDGDSCLEWGGFQSCICSNDQCKTCYDECSVFDSGCKDSDTYWKCEYNLATGCYEKENYNCSSGKVCSNGDCIIDCSNECNTKGEKNCINSTSIETCGDYDADSCLEWGGEQSCKCCNDACQSCTDECDSGDNGCNSAKTKKWSCKKDPSTCCYYEDYTSCSSNEVCQNGSCVAKVDNCASKKCNGGDVWCYNSNGNADHVYDSCDGDVTSTTWKCDGSSKAVYIQTNKDVYCSNAVCQTSTSESVLQTKNCDCGCSNGSCVSPCSPTCTNECSVGEKGCNGSTQKWTCAKVGDCYKKQYASCASGETCSGGSCVKNCSPIKNKKACVSDKLVWLDACGGQTSVIENCAAMLATCNDNNDGVWSGGFCSAQDLKCYYATNTPCECGCESADCLDCPTECAKYNEDCWTNNDCCSGWCNWTWTDWFCDCPEESPNECGGDCWADCSTDEEFQCDGGIATCVEKSCSPAQSEMVCDGDKLVWLDGCGKQSSIIEDCAVMLPGCNENNSGVYSKGFCSIEKKQCYYAQITYCDPDEKCENGGCVCKNDCLPFPEYSCVTGKTSMQCVQSGACFFAKITECDVSFGGCNLLDGKCFTSCINECASEETGCKGSSQKWECLKVGSCYYKQQTTCPAGTSCSAGACVDSCLPAVSKKACVGDKLVWLDACGKQTSVIDDCTVMKPICNDSKDGIWSKGFCSAQDLKCYYATNTPCECGCANAVCSKNCEDNQSCLITDASWSAGMVKDSDEVKMIVEIQGNCQSKTAEVSIFHETDGKGTPGAITYEKIWFAGAPIMIPWKAVYYNKEGFNNANGLDDFAIYHFELKSDFQATVISDNLKVTPTTIEIGIVSDILNSSPVEAADMDAEICLNSAKWAVEVLDPGSEIPPGFGEECVEVWKSLGWNPIEYIENLPDEFYSELGGALFAVFSEIIVCVAPPAICSASVWVASKVPNPWTVAISAIICGESILLTNFLCNGEMPPVVNKFFARIIRLTRLDKVIANSISDIKVIKKFIGPRGGVVQVVEKDATNAYRLYPYKTGTSGNVPVPKRLLTKEFFLDFKGVSAMSETSAKKNVALPNLVKLSKSQLQKIDSWADEYTIALENSEKFFSGKYPPAGASIEFKNTDNGCYFGSCGVELEVITLPMKSINAKISAKDWALKNVFYHEINHRALKKAIKEAFLSWNKNLKVANGQDGAWELLNDVATIEQLQKIGGDELASAYKQIQKEFYSSQFEKDAMNAIWDYLSEEQVAKQKLKTYYGWAKLNGDDAWINGDFKNTVESMAVDFDGFVKAADEFLADLQVMNADIQGLAEINSAAGKEFWEIGLKHEMFELDLSSIAAIFVGGEDKAAGGQNGNQFYIAGQSIIYFNLPQDASETIFADGIAYSRSVDFSSNDNGDIESETDAIQGRIIYHDLGCTMGFDGGQRWIGWLVAFLSGAVTVAVYLKLRKRWK